MKDICEYLDMTENEFNKHCDKFRSPHLWKEKKEWKLRHTSNMDGTDD